MHTSDLVILQVAPLNWEKISGFTKNVPGLCNALAEMGARVGLVSSLAETGIPPVKSNFEFFPRPNRIAELPPPFNSPHFVGFHGVYSFPQVSMARELRKRQIPYIISPRVSLMRDAQNQKRIKKAIGNILIFNQFINGAKALHCLTGREASQTIAWDVPKFIVGNGINLPSSTNVVSFEDKAKNINISFIGRIDFNHKGLDLLIGALGLKAHLFRQHSTTVDLYGPATQVSAKQLGKLIGQHGLQDLVVWHGPVKGVDLQAAFNSAHVFIHTSRFEGHPTAVLEAMGYGIPCIVTPGTNMVADIMASDSGWVTAGDKEQIARTLESVISTGIGEIQRRGRNARSFVEQEYSWSLLAERYLRGARMYCMDNLG